MLMLATLTLASLTPLATSGAGEADAPAASSHVEAGRFDLLVDGEWARGYLAYPRDRAPDTLLVYAHGCCGQPDMTNLVRGIAEAYDVAAVAMTYRGNGHWNVGTGHRDTIAATEAVQTMFPTITRTVVWGVSMGGEVSGMAVAARPDLYTYWVDTFGVTDLFQEFVALGLYPGIAPQPGDLANPIGSWILEETGGLPGVAPLEAWVERSPVYRAAEMVGLKRAYLHHGVADLIVYPSETMAMFAGLVEAGVPASMCLALTGPGGTQGPFVPGVGAPWLPTPYGPAAHDGRGFACTNQVLDALLRGGEPDEGTVASVTVMDLTTGQRVGVPVPPAAPVPTAAR